MTAYIWLTKLILSHLLTDFVLQPGSWVADRKQKHFASGKLYLHVLVTAGLAYILLGWQYWLVALIILITHFVIDGWKSYRPAIVLILVLQSQYAAIGLLITAKGIIRYNEKDRQEVKTEYLVIGTLLSIGTAIVTGLAVKLFV